MDVVLVSISNIKYLSYNKSLGIGLIHQYLYERGHDARCLDYFLDLGSEHNQLDFATTVPELADLPLLLALVANFRSGAEDLLAGLDDLTARQREMLERLRSSVDALEVPPGAVFGLSATYLSYPYCVLFALLIRRRDPSATIVFGGYHVTLSRNVRDFTLRSGVADVVVVGDGGEPMLDVVEGRLRQGVVAGRFPRSAPWPRETHRRAAFDNQAIASLTSVGCPFNCFFCASKREHVQYDLDAFTAYVRELKEMTGVEHLRLVDDEVNPTRARGMALAERMRGLGLSWDAFMTPVNLDEQLADALAESGCVGAFLGTESFSDQRLRSFNKPSSGERNLRAISLLADRDIIVTVGIIFGFPGETWEEAERDVAMCRQLKERYGELVYLAATCYKLYPGSEHYDHPLRHGLALSCWGPEYQGRVPEVDEVIVRTPRTFEVRSMPSSEARQMEERVTQLEPPYADPATRPCFMAFSY